MARLIKRIANANKSIEDFVDDLMSAQADGVDVDEYLSPTGDGNIFYDVADDLGLIAFTGDEASVLVNAFVKYGGKSKKEARELAINALANFDGDRDYAEQIVKYNRGNNSTCYVFDTVNFEIVTCDDDTIELVIQTAIDEVLQSRTSTLLEDLERDFYQKNPEYE